MKNVWAFASFAILISVFQSQQSIAQDTTATFSNKDLGKKPHQDMLLVDLNWDHMIGYNGNVNQKWYGRGIAVSLMYDYPLNRNGNVSLAIGGGFASHNYYTNALVQKVPGTELAAFQVQPKNIKDKGKFSLNYVDVPVEIRFRTDENARENRWKLAAGARVGYLISAHEKIIDNQGFKTKLYHYPHVALFRYGPTVRFGYGAVMVTGFYSVSTLFQTGKGFYDLNALSVGITISPF